MEKSSNLVIDFQKICRTCMQEGDMINLNINCDRTSCLIEKLMHCTFIEIVPKDGLPSQICTECLENVNSAYSFAKKCEKTDKFLRKAYLKIKESLLKNQKINTVQDPVINVEEEQCSNSEIITGKENLTEKSNINIIIEPIESESDDNIVDFDTKIYTDHTYTKNSSKSIIKSKTVEKSKNLKINIVHTNLKQNTKNGPPFVCKKCDSSFLQYHELKLHHKTHTNKKYEKKKCPICDKIVSYGHLTHHLRIHSSEKRYCCEFCGKRFILSSNMIRHKRTHSGERPYKCDFCNKCFIQSTRLQEHRRLHTGEKPYQCNVCGLAFAQFSNFKFHMKRHNGEDAKSRKPRTTPTVDLHCEICNQLFKSTGALKTHLQTHQEKKFPCSDCTRSFTDSVKLQNHRKIHFGNRPYSCSICGKSFTAKNTLNNHMVIHSGNRPYRCEVCDKSFIQVGHLKYHKRIHSGEKPHVCKYCGRRFNLNGNLTVHLRTHTGETPYICDVCDKGFYDSSAMKKHRKRHEKFIIHEDIIVERNTE